MTVLMVRICWTEETKMDAWLSVRHDLVACSVSQSVHCYVCALLCLCIVMSVHRRHGDARVIVWGETDGRTCA